MQQRSGLGPTVAIARQSLSSASEGWEIVGGVHPGL
jgi:hypothetical protein